MPPNTEPKKRRFDECRNEMLRVYGTPKQFAALMHDNARRGWHTQTEVDEAIQDYYREWKTAKC